MPCPSRHPGESDILPSRSPALSGLPAANRGASLRACAGGLGRVSLTPGRGAGGLGQAVGASVTGEREAAELPPTPRTHAAVRNTKREPLALTSPPQSSSRWTSGGLVKNISLLSQLHSAHLASAGDAEIPKELIKHPMTYIGFPLDSEGGKVTRNARLPVPTGFLLPRKTGNRM